MEATQPAVQAHSQADTHINIYIFVIVVVALAAILQFLQQIIGEPREVEVYRLHLVR
jgi:hypothetical protein